MTDDSVINIRDDSINPDPHGNLTTRAPLAPGTSQQPDFLSDIDKSDQLQSGLVGPAKESQSQQTIADNFFADRFNKDRRDMQESWNLERSAAHDPALRPWNADQERANRVRGPMEQFGSVGFVFAMAASAFTRTPMTSALNAGAAAMTAIQEGDEKAYKSAYQAWKDNSDLALRRFDIEHRLYEDADKLLTTDMNLWKQRTLEIATQFDDTKKIAMLEKGLDPDVLKSREALIKSKVEILKAQESFEQFENQRRMISDGIKALRKSHPDWKDDNKGPEQAAAEAQVYAKAVQASKGVQQVREPTPDQQQYDLLKQKYGNDPDKLSEKWGEFKRGQHQPAGQAAAAARAAKQVQTEQQRKAVVDDYVTDIDTALQRVEKMKKSGWGPQVGSAAGATKLFETAMGKTDVADLQRNLAQLKEHYKEVFSGKGRALSAEFKELDTLIPGEIQGFNLSLNKGFSFPRFDRLQNVENALVDLRERIKKRYDDLITVEGPAETPAAPAQGGVHELSTEELRQQLIERGYDPDKL